MLERAQTEGKGGYMQGGEAGYQKERLSPGRIALLEG